jgi:methanogenic corrinoid protein MtbC1
LVHPELLGLPGLAEEATRSSEVDGDATAVEAGRLTEALRQGRAEEVRGIMMRLYLSGWSVAEICDGPVLSSMTSIGQLWKEGSYGIFVEHRASDLCAQALHQLRSVILVQEGAAAAVGGGPARDQHVLGSLMVAAVMASEGIDAINLGPDTPARVLLQAAERHGAQYLWLSIGARQAAARLRAQVEELIGGIDALARNSAGPSPYLLIGGRQRGLVAGMSHPRLFTGGSLSELVAFVRGATGRTPR